jgi:uncharacterized Zn-finger protein
VAIQFAARSADPRDMPKAQWVECPICDTDVALDGAGPGDEVFCSYCGAPITIAKISDDESVEIEDY